MSEPSIERSIQAARVVERVTPGVRECLHRERLGAGESGPEGGIFGPDAGAGEGDDSEWRFWGQSGRFRSQKSPLMQSSLSAVTTFGHLGTWGNHKN